MDNAEQRIEPEEAVAAAIDAAEEVHDPLDGLVERTATDPGAPFVPDALERLAALQNSDLARFEALRAQLKAAGCRVTALDKALAGEDGDTGGREAKQADVLIELAAQADLFHTADGHGLRRFRSHGHRETWAIRSKMFKRWLARLFFEETRKAANSEALQSALNVIEAKAHFNGPERPVFIRVGGHEGKLYLDLCDDRWRAVEIDARGWRVVDNPPVRFRRASGMKPLPIPVSGGSIKMLRPFLNVQSDIDFVLAVSWMLAVLRDRGPYPVLVSIGRTGIGQVDFLGHDAGFARSEHGTLRALPREDRDLFIAATNGHVLTFDNVSGLRAWMSDTLCRLATGGGFAVRQLYTDQDEVLFDAARPVILNGIEDIVERPDLADRALFLTLEPIPAERRRPEAELWAAFETNRPRILGALLDAVVEGIKRLPDTHLPELPRMADFAMWATACETALWPAGTFWSAYCRNRDEAVEGVIEADPVAAAVRALMSTQTVWTGTASDLLGALAEGADERISKSKTWPDSPRALSGRLRRAATFLRKIGIEVAFKKEGRARTRIIHIGAYRTRKCGDTTVPTVCSVRDSRPNPHAPLNSRLNHCGRWPATRTVTRLQPSARSLCKSTPGTWRTVRTQNHPRNLRPEEPERLAGGAGYECGLCSQDGTCPRHPRALRRRRSGAGSLATAAVHSARPPVSPQGRDLEAAPSGE